MDLLIVERDLLRLLKELSCETTEEEEAEPAVEGSPPGAPWGGERLVPFLLLYLPMHVPTPPLLPLSDLRMFKIPR